MSAYYNEHDPFAAAWLRELIKAGQIAPGIVDERSIEDVPAKELFQYTQCHFFAGIGVWSYALRQAGWPDDRPIWTGSCPCQPFSAAGKGAGFDDERHLWPAFHWLIDQCRPVTVVGEQVASKDGLDWIDLVLSDLEGSDYSTGAIDTCAAGVGAPHIRQRLYWVGHTFNTRLERHGRDVHGGQGRQIENESIAKASFWDNAEWLECRDGKRRPVEPGSAPLVDGAPARVGRLRGYGNALVAPQAQAFIEAVMSITRQRS